MSGSRPGPWLADVLTGRQVGELIPLPWPQAIDGKEFTHAVVEKDFKTKSRAQLLRFLPGDVLYISKFEDIRKELAVMRVLQRMNERWRQTGVLVCGLPVEVVTYSIIPLGTKAGLVEVVPQSWTLRELSQTCHSESRRLRVLRALHHDVTRLDKLAASTMGYLTAGYALGIRDSHDDNIMLRADGSLFRIDFGFIFGATPEIDAPQTVVPLAVTTALSASRWAEVVAASGRALSALSGSAASCLPGWGCIEGVAEMQPWLSAALVHARGLSLGAFCHDVRCANEWSLSRAAKNGFRELIRYLTEEAPPEPSSQKGSGSLEEEDAETPRGRPCASWSSSRWSAQGAALQLPPDDPFAPAPPPLPPGDPFAPSPSERMQQCLDLAEGRVGGGGAPCAPPSGALSPRSDDLAEPDLVPLAQPGPLPPDDPFGARASPTGRPEAWTKPPATAAATDRQHPAAGAQSARSSDDPTAAGWERLPAGAQSACIPGCPRGAGWSMRRVGQAEVVARSLALPASVGWQGMPVDLIPLGLSRAVC